MVKTPSWALYVSQNLIYVLKLIHSPFIYKCCFQTLLVNTYLLFNLRVQSSLAPESSYRYPTGLISLAIYSHSNFYFSSYDLSPYDYLLNV